MSPGQHLAGVLALAATFVGIEALFLAYVDTTPANMSGVQLGAFLGLGSLAIEFQCLRRAYRNRFRDPAQVTLLSFLTLTVTVAGEPPTNVGEDTDSMWPPGTALTLFVSVSNRSFDVISSSRNSHLIAPLPPSVGGVTVKVAS